MTTRIQEATAIRDHLVALVQADGFWESVGGLPQMMWARAGWMARLACPSELLGTAGTSRAAAPSKLSLTEGKSTLFNVEWAPGGPIRVLAFERGAWEGKLLSLPLPREA